MKNEKRPKLPFEVWALVIGGFTIALGYGVVAPVIPQFAKEFGVTNLQATAVISSFALMRLVFAPVAGIIVTKVGERITYVFGLSFVAAMTGLAVFVTSYGQLLATRALAGIGSTMFTISATALMIKVMPVTERGRVAGINSAGFLLGNILGPVLGAIVAGYGMRAPFIVYFFALIAAAIFVGLALRKSKHVGAAEKGKDDNDFTVKDALKIKQFRGALVSTFAHGWSAFGVRVSLIPLFVVGALAGSESQAGWALAAYAAGNAILVLPSGRLNDKIGRKPMLIVGLLVSGIAFLAMPLSAGIMTLLIFMFVSGMGSALTNPAQQATVADVVGKKKGGGVVAATQMTADLGAILGPLVAGVLIDEVSFFSAFAVTGAILIIASLTWMVLPDSRKLVGDTKTAPIEVISPTEPVTGSIRLPGNK